MKEMLEEGKKEINLIFERKKLKEAIRRNQWQKARKKIEQKLLEGWADVYKDIENLPFCELQDQATKVFLCLKCDSCGITGMCVACNSRGIFHPLLGRGDVWKLKASGVKLWN